MGASSFVAYVRCETAQEVTMASLATVYPFDPLEFGPPHFYVDDGGVYRYNAGESVLVSKNVERWARFCVHD